MRRLTLSLLLVACLACGCKNSPGKTTSRPRPEKSAPADDAWWRKDGEKPEPFGPVGTPTGNSGNSGDPDKPASRTNNYDSLLAGRVLDDSDRGVPDAFVRVTAPGQEGKKPVGVNTDRQGFFVVEGLQPGRTYELSARVEDGKRVLGQTVVTRAPNARIVIRVTEAGVSSLTPEAQTPVGDVGPFAKPRPAEAPPKERPKPDPVPSTLPTPDPVGGDPIGPERTQESSPAPAPAPSGGNTAAPPPPARKNTAPVDPSLVGGTDDPRRPPAANIPGPSRYVAPTPNPAPPRPAPPRPITGQEATPPSGGGDVSTAPKFDFTVRGLQQEADWRFSQASGRLILLDFWSTTCVPCLKAMPETNQLASTYAASGLEVIGIACEAPDRYETQASTVAQVAQRNRLKYGVYLDGERNTAQKLFQVKSVPTMVLLDRKGNVLWRGTGASRENFEQLEEAIKRGLRRQ